MCCVASRQIIDLAWVKVVTLKTGVVIVVTTKLVSPLLGVTLKNGEFSTSFFIFFTSNLEASPFSRADRDFSEKKPQSSRRNGGTIEIMASGHWKMAVLRGKTSIFSPKWRHHRNNGERALEKRGFSGENLDFLAEFGSP